MTNGQPSSLPDSNRVYLLLLILVNLRRVICSMPSIKLVQLIDDEGLRWGKIMDSDFYMLLPKKLFVQKK